MSTIKTWEERLPAILNTPEEIANARDAEITELREALKGEQECNVRLDADWQRCMKEKSELQAKLSAIEAQEPELWARYPRTGRNTPPEVVTKKPEDADSWVAFYAHPVAPAQPVNELVEALREAAAFIHAVNIGKKPEVRYPLADELDGFAAILANAKAAPVAPAQPAKETYDQY